MTTVHDVWDPAQYDRFREERSRPFHDLVALLQPEPGLTVVDLGCGNGELTRALHRRLKARATLGLDSSPAMLAGAQQLATDGLRFAAGDIATWAPPPEGCDLVFSNAALQWLPDHATLFARLSRALRPGGQLAVQIPANEQALSHRLAVELAARPPFAALLGGATRRPQVLSPEAYARLLDRLGYAEQHVRLQVYAHRLSAREQVVDWVKGTLLTYYRARLAPADYQRFEDSYRAELMTRLPDERPFFFPFERILLWARRARA